MFDREELAEYSFTVMAMDIGGRTGFTTLHVAVGDENDNKPVFVQSEYKMVVRANTTIGSTIIRVIIKDLFIFSPYFIYLYFLYLFFYFIYLFLRIYLFFFYYLSRIPLYFCPFSGVLNSYNKFHNTTFKIPLLF